MDFIEILFKFILLIFAVSALIITIKDNYEKLKQ